MAGHWATPRSGRLNGSTSVGGSSKISNSNSNSSSNGSSSGASRWQSQQRTSASASQWRRQGARPPSGHASALLLLLTMMATMLALAPTPVLAIERSVVSNEIPWPVPTVQSERIGGNISTIASLQQCVEAPAPLTFTLKPASADGGTERVWGGFLVVNMYNAAEDLGQLNEVFLNGRFLGVAGGDPGSYSQTTFTFSADEIGGVVDAARSNNVTIVNQGLVGGWTTCATWVRLVVHVLSDRQFNTTEGSVLNETAPGLMSAASDFDVVKVANVTSPSYGNATFEESGAFTYTPPYEDWNGVDTFQFTLSDGNGLRATANVTIVVEPVDDPPRLNENSTLYPSDALGDIFPSAVNTRISIPLIGSTVPAGIDPASVTPLWQGEPMFIPAPLDTVQPVLVVTQPPAAAGSVVVVNGTAVVYTPKHRFKGVANFTVAARNPSDPSLQTDPVPMRINVAGLPRAAKPTLNGATVTAPTCTRIQVPSIDVTTGSVAMVANSRGDMRSVGAPSGFDVQVMRPSTAPTAACEFKLSAVSTGATRKSFAFSSCAPCLKCLKSIQHTCDSTNALVMRVRARGGGMMGDASEWAETSFNVTCASGLACQWA